MIQAEAPAGLSSREAFLRTLLETLQGANRPAVLDVLLKERGVNMLDLFHNFQLEEVVKVPADGMQVLQHSQPVLFSSEGEQRSYDLYLQVPAVIVLEGNCLFEVGCVEISYTDLEGERKRLDQIDCRLSECDRMFEVSRSLLAGAVKPTDLNLLSEFRIQNPQGVPTLALLINNAAFEAALEARQHLHITRILRHREVLKHYGVEVESTVYTQQKLSKTISFTAEHPFVLLLSGKLLIMKDTLMLSCYNEGMFSRITNEKLVTKFIVLTGSEILTCSEIWKNQKYQEGQLRRLKYYGGEFRHLQAVLARYKDMPEKEVKRLQKAFLQENELNPDELEQYMPKKKLRPHQSLKEQATLVMAPKLAKKLSQNSQADDLKSTKTSLEKRCTIRIRVKKK